MTAMNPQPPLVPPTGDEPVEEPTTTDPDIVIDDEDDDGVRLDPDVNDDLVDSAEADRLATGAEDQG